MGSKGTNTVTQQSAPPPQFMAAYTDLLNRGNQTANQPLQQYQGPLVAGFTPDQSNAFNQVEQASGIAQPFYNTAAQYAAQGANPIQTQQFSNNAIQQYQNPFTQQVIDSTMQNVNQQNQLQQQNLLSAGIKQGNAFGGDRAGLAQSALANQQDLAKNQTIAGLESQGYGQALGEFNTQQQTQLQQQANDAARAAQASYQFGNIGQGIQGSALTGANALLNTGQQQQALAQQQLNIPYGQFQQQQAYPFQTTNFLAGLTSGLGSQAGGSSQTQGPGASGLGQMLGLGQLGLGAYNAFGGAGAAAAGTSMAGLSDIFGAGASSLGPLAIAGLPFGFKHGGGVPHYDVGGQTGLPGDPMAMGIPLAGATKGVPNIGALSYLQPIQIHGSGPPKPPSMPHTDQNQQLASNVKAAQNLVGGLGKDFGPNSQPSSATNYVDNVLSQSNPQPVQPQPDDVGYARGGIAHYALGGPTPMQSLGLANSFGNITGDRTGPVNTALGNAAMTNMLSPPQQGMGMAQGGAAHFPHGGLVHYAPSTTGIPTPQVDASAFRFNPNITGDAGGVAQQHQMPPMMGGLAGLPGMPQGSPQGGPNPQGGPMQPPGPQNAPSNPWQAGGSTFMGPSQNGSGTLTGQGGNPLYVGPPSQQYNQPLPNMHSQHMGSGYNSIYALPQIPLSSMPSPNTIYTTGSIAPPNAPNAPQAGIGSGGFDASAFNFKSGGLIPHFDQAGAVDEAALPADAVPASIAPPTDANVEIPKQRDMTPYQHAIHSVESVDQKDPYIAIGPPTRSGDRALGKYQVMSQNIPQWTNEALGKPMNAAEFLHNPQAQDAVFNHRFGKYLDQYGNPQDAASMWFAGKPLAQAGNANDGYTTTPRYVSDFTKALNQSGGLGGQPQPTSDDLDPHPEIDHSGDTVRVNYPSTKESLDTGLPGKSAWQKLVGGEPFMSRNAGLALMQSGLATMAAASRPGATALGSLGVGGQEGLQQYIGQQKEDETREAVKQALIQNGIDPNVATAASRSKDYMQYMQHNQMTPYQKGELQKPVPIGQTMDMYGGVHTQFGVRQPDGSFVDPVTRQPVAPNRPGMPPQAPNAPGVPQSEAAPPKAVTTQQGAELNPDEANLPRNAQMVAADLTPSTANPQYLKDAVESGKMTAADAEAVKAIDEGRRAFPPQSRSNPRNVMLANWVHEYDPGFDQGATGARQSLRKQYLGGGKASDNILSFDMTMQHVGRFLQSADKLDNYTYAPGMVNPVRNAFRAQSDPKYQESVAGFNKDADAVASELMRATRGVGAGTLEEIRAWRNGLDPNASPVTQRAAAKEAINLLYGRIAAQGQRWNDGMKTDKDPLSWLSPEAGEAFQNIYGMDASKSLKDQGITFAEPRFARLQSVAQKAQGKPEPKPAEDSGPKVGEEKQFKQGIGVWDGTKWVPKGQP